MSIDHPLISVCIPAFNRAKYLSPLLESIANQKNVQFEIVIAEDHSPEREDIRGIVKSFVPDHNIRYYENVINLGYDANLRNLIEKAEGEYCFFMGNDDLMAPNALETVAAAIQRYPDIGVVLRSYASFDDSPENINQVFRYFPEERFFPAGPSSVATFYRRSVVIPGMVVNRRAALKYSTDRFDGTLLYQLYLVANILLEKNGVFLPETLALYRNGGVPDFGASQKELKIFTPGEQTPESSLRFMQGMLQIAAWVERERRVCIYNSIVRDIANYSYPILAIQARRPFSVFIRYAYGLARMGLWRFWRFHAFLAGILLLGTNRIEAVVCFIKEKLGYTPKFGSIYSGKSK